MAYSIVCIYKYVLVLQECQSHFLLLNGNICMTMFALFLQSSEHLLGFFSFHYLSLANSIKPETHETQLKGWKTTFKGC